MPLAPLPVRPCKLGGIEVVELASFSFEEMRRKLDFLFIQLTCQVSGGLRVSEARAFKCFHDGTPSSMQLYHSNNAVYTAASVARGWAGAV